MLPQVDWNSLREMGRNPPFFPVGTQWETRGKNAWRGLGTKGFAQKKVLSLVLCVAMLLSVMVMGTGAAFTDQDEIQNAEAVDMTSALGIIDGYEDGSFQPAENIERGEAAKMISAMLNGGRDSVQETTESSYNDVLGSVDAWANKYIEYCTARGIVSGVGGDRFAPASNVTGTQLAKMLLVSLGYDSVKEGYQDNAMWSVNVNTDAVAAGLYAGIETIDMSAPLSRDNAAQMIWNALQANTVYYLTNISDATVTNTTLLAEVYDAGTTTGVMTNIGYNKDTGVYTYTVEPVDSSANLTSDQNDTLYVESTTDYSDLFAMNVTVLHKDDSAMMIRVNEGGTVVEGVWGDISGTNNNNNNTINVNGTTYRLDNVANDQPANYEAITIAYNNYFNSTETSLDTYTATYDQYSFRAIDQDGGGDIDVIVVYPYVVMKTDLVTSSSFRVNKIDGNDAYLTVLATNQDRTLITDLTDANSNNIVEFADVQVNGTVAIDGYVKATPAQYTAQGEDTYDVLTMANASVTRAANRDLLITLGDTQYDGNLLEQIDSFKQISVGKEYGFIAVNGYLFIMDGTGIVPENYAVMTALAESSSAANGTIKADLLLSDGTIVDEASVKLVHDDNDVYTYYDGMTVGDLFTYVLKSDGTYELTPAADGTAKGTTSIYDLEQTYNTGANLNGVDLDGWKTVNNVSNGTPIFSFNNAEQPTFKNATKATETYVIEDDAVIFAFIDRTPGPGDQRTDEYVVLTGADLANVDKDDVTWAFTGATEKTQNVYTVDMAYIKLTADPRDSAEYAYVADVNERSNNNGHYAEIDVITVNGDSTLTTAAYESQRDPVLMDVYNNLEEGSVYLVIYDKDGNLVGYGKQEFSYGTVYGVNGSTIILTDGTNLTTNDAHMINIDGTSIQAGEVIAYSQNDENDVTPDLIVYGLAEVSEDISVTGIGTTTTVKVDRDINKIHVELSKTSGDAWTATTGYSLKVTYANQNAVIVNGVHNGTTIEFDFNATADIDSMEISYSASSAS